MDADDLLTIPLFANVSGEVREKAATRLKEVNVVLGTPLARQGDFAYHFFVVREGLAAVTVDDKHVDTLGPGATFGEIGVLERGKRTANVVAITPMRLLTMTGLGLQRPGGVEPGVRRARQDDGAGAALPRLSVSTGPLSSHRVSIRAHRGFASSPAGATRPGRAHADRSCLAVSCSSHRGRGRPGWRWQR